MIIFSGDFFHASEFKNIKLNGNLRIQLLI